LLDRPEYRKWRDLPSSSVLCIQGEAGHGKSFLSSRVIDNILEDREVRGSQEAIAYYYCDRNDAQRSDPQELLRSVIKQLASLNNAKGDPLQLVVENLYTQQKNTGFSANKLGIKVYKDLISKLTNIYPQTIIVIDALDEFDLVSSSEATREDIIKFFMELAIQSTNLVKIFLTTRPAHADIDRPLKEVKSYTRGYQHYITLENNKMDIDAYISYKVTNVIIPKLKGNQDLQGLEKLIISTLSEKANGMFLWVGLTIKQLTGSTSAKEITLGLKQLPRTLPHTFQRMFEQIKDIKFPGRSEKAMLALKWTIGAKVPLPPAALIGALYCSSSLSSSSSSSSSSQSESELDNIDDIDDIIQFCNNFLILDRESKVVRFAHLSMQKFLEKSPEFHQGEFQICWSLARACLRCLLISRDINKSKNLSVMHSIPKKCGCFRQGEGRVSL